MSVVALQLSGNIIKALEFATPSSLKNIQSWVEKEKIQPYIDVKLSKDVENGIFFTPQANLNEKIFKLSGPYLDALWIYVFSTIVEYEMLESQTILNLGGKSPYRTSSVVYHRTQENKKWIEKLKIGIDLWPQTCPYPNSANWLSQIETDYILKANEIFEKTLSVVMFHEIAHIILGHDNVIKGCVKNDEIEQLEKEADNFSTDFLKTDWKNENDELGYLFSIVFSCTSLLTFISSPRMLKQDVHTDVDIRIYNIITSALSEINEFGKQDYFYGLACYILREYVTKNDRCKIAKPFPTGNMLAKDLFTYYIDQIEIMKNYYM